MSSGQAAIYPSDEPGNSDPLRYLPSVPDVAVPLHLLAALRRVSGSSIRHSQTGGFTKFAKPRSKSLLLNFHSGGAKPLHGSPKLQHDSRHLGSPKQQLIKLRLPPAVGSRAESGSLTSSDGGLKTESPMKQRSAVFNFLQRSSQRGQSKAALQRASSIAASFDDSIPSLTDSTRSGHTTPTLSSTPLSECRLPSRMSRSSGSLLDEGSDEGHFLRCAYVSSSHASLSSYDSFRMSSRAETKRVRRFSLTLKSTSSASNGSSSSSEKRKQLFGQLQSSSGSNVPPVSSGASIHSRESVCSTKSNTSHGTNNTAKSLSKRLRIDSFIQSTGRLFRRSAET